MKLKLAVVTLWGEDVQQMSDFYEHVLGLPLVFVDRGRPHFDFGGGYLTILSGQPRKVQDTGQARFPVIAFAVDDLYEIIHQLKSHKVELPWGVEEDRDSRWVMFYDPGGNLIEAAMMGIKKHPA
jgi:catechol 2,3-dioxygenase-like lactoylglutathione lyase family enzyme